MTELEFRARIRKLMGFGALPSDSPSIERHGACLAILDVARADLFGEAREMADEEALA